MAQRVKYRKSVRDGRKRVADLWRKAREEMRAGRCGRAGELYNEGVMLTVSGKGVIPKNTSFMRMQKLLQKCNKKHGWRS